MVFIGRSGHTEGVPVPDIEMKLRLFLERAMYTLTEKRVYDWAPCFLFSGLCCIQKVA